MTDPTGTPYGDDAPEDDPGTAQTKAENTQGMSNPHDRPVQLSWLHGAVDILLEVAKDQPSPGHRAYAQLKALMLAGWLAPEERTLAVPNGLVLTEVQWKALAEYDDVTVVLPGGQRALTLRVSASHPRPHFQPGSPFHEELWAERARAAIEASGQAWGRGYGKTTSPSTETHDWKVPVPRSFLTNLVAFAHALREAGDYAAANSLDTFLASIDAELMQFGIDHIDSGRDKLPDMNAQARTKHLIHAMTYDPQLYRDVRTVLEYVSAGRRGIGALGTYPDNVARRALGRLDDLERATGNPPPLTPEAVRRAGEGLTGKTFTVKIPGGTSPTGRLGWPTQPQPQHVPFGGPGGQEQVDAYMESYEREHGAQPQRTILSDRMKRILREQFADGYDQIIESQSRHTPHPATTEEDLRHQLGQRTDDCAKVRDALLPILQSHEQTKDEVATPQPDTLRAGYVAKIAAGLILWYAVEVERLKRDGIPGVIHEVDRAFYDLAVKERNLERMKLDRMENEVNQLKGALESTQRGLVRMETQRDDLRTAIAMAAGVDPDQISEIDTDYEDLLKETLAQREASRLVQDAVAEDQS